MRFKRLALPILISLAVIECRSVPPAPVAAVPCAAVTQSLLTVDWDPRSLAGQFRVEWVSDTGSIRQTRRLRLLLWPTSIRDSSIRRHKSPVPGDTARHPLYGVMVRDTGKFSSARIARLRAGVDPIYPPVLLIAMLIKNPPMPARYWTVLVIGTVANRRDGVLVTDGGGLGMWVRDSDTNGFRGTFGPFGIVSDDNGHYCAQRVSS
jgi:hypothetical protein